jgi:hypothetical protein
MPALAIIHFFAGIKADDVFSLFLPIPYKRHDIHSPYKGFNKEKTNILTIAKFKITLVILNPIVKILVFCRATAMVSL